MGWFGWEEKRSQQAGRQVGGRAPTKSGKGLPPFCTITLFVCVCGGVVRNTDGLPASDFVGLLLLLISIAITSSSYLLVGLLLGGLLGGDGLLRAALLEHRLRDDGLGLAAHHGRHGC